MPSRRATSHQKSPCTLHKSMYMTACRNHSACPLLQVLPAWQIQIEKGGCLFICSIIYGTLYSTYPLCHSCSPAEIYFVSSAAKQLHKTLQFRSKYLTNAGKIIILTSFNSFKAVIFNQCAAGDLQMCCRSLWEGSSIVVGPLGDVSLHSTV